VETTLRIKKAGIEPRLVAEVTTTEMNNSIIGTIYASACLLFVLAAFVMFMQQIGIIGKLLA